MPTIVTRSDIAKFFSKKWKTVRCPFCGETKWSISTEHNSEVVRATSGITFCQEENVGVIDGGNIEDAALPADEREPEPTDALVSVRCENCYYVAHFDLRGIRDEIGTWQKETGNS